MKSREVDLPVLVAGGGIGGLAAALALTRRGFAVKVLEQAAELGEIGAGIQFGPNAFAALDALGIGERARDRAVYIDEMVMHDALDEFQVGCIPTGEAFRQRFGNPYAVIHRADIHMALLEGSQETGRIEVCTSTAVQQVEQDEHSVTVADAKAGHHRGVALIAADGVKSAVRAQYVGDEARVPGHVVYRAVVDMADFRQDLQWSAASIWVGPNCQGACMAMEDGVTLGEAMRVHANDFPKAFAHYQRSRVARTARIVLSAREMGRIFHAKGVERLCATTCGKATRPNNFMMRWNGCMAGRSPTVWPIDPPAANLSPPDCLRSLNHV